MSAADSARTQRALLALLAQPLVTYQCHPVLYRTVREDIKQVTSAARRLGYEIHQTGRALRLTRIPLAGTVAAPPPPRDMPSGRVLALVCVAAAACEESDGFLTLQELSDMVRTITCAPGATIGVYDPDQRWHRRQLVAAVTILEAHGVLLPRMTGEQAREDWASNQHGAGGAFQVDRDALLLLTIPAVVAAGAAVNRPDRAPGGREAAADTRGAAADGVLVGGGPEGEVERWAATRRLRILRQLVETPAVVYADCEASDAAALAGSIKSVWASEAATLTGGHVEMRAEGMILVLPADQDMPTLVEWPRPVTRDWVALLFADLAGRAGTRQDDGSVLLTDADLDEVAADLAGWKRDYLTKDLRDDPAAIRRAAVEDLTYLGLLQTEGFPLVTGAATIRWRLSPVAARYRDPDVTVINAHRARQEELEG